MDENKSTLIASVGKVGETKPLTIPRFEAVTAQFTPTSQRVTWLSKFLASIIKAVDFTIQWGSTPFESIQKKEKFHALRDFFVFFGVLLCYALYHFGLFLQRREDVGSTVFRSIHSFSFSKARWG